jgi:hypothetical protein
MTNATRKSSLRTAGNQAPCRLAGRNRLRALGRVVLASGLKLKVFIAKLTL